MIVVHIMNYHHHDHLCYHHHHDHHHDHHYHYYHTQSDDGTIGLHGIASVMVLVRDSSVGFLKHHHIGMVIVPISCFLEGYG